MINKPATESSGAQGPPFSYTPVSLLVMLSLPLPVTLLDS